VTVETLCVSDAGQEQGLYGVAELAEGKRLVEEGVDAGGAGAFADIEGAVAADHENRYCGAMRAAADALYKFEAADAGQIKIRDDHVEGGFHGEHRQRGLGIVYGRHIAERREHEFEERADVNVVVGHEDALGGGDAPMRGKILHTLDFGQLGWRA